MDNCFTPQEALQRIVGLRSVVRDELFRSSNKYKKERELWIGAIVAVFFQKIYLKKLIINTVELSDEPPDIRLYETIEKRKRLFRDLEITEAHKSNFSSNSGTPHDDITKRLIEKIEKKIANKDYNNEIFVIYLNFTNKIVFDKLSKHFNKKKPRTSEIWTLGFVEVSEKKVILLAQIYPKYLIHWIKNESIETILNGEHKDLDVEVDSYPLNG